MSVRQTLTAIRFPGKRFLSRNRPRMVPRIDAIKVDARDILRVTPMIPSVSELKLMIPQRFNPGASCLPAYRGLGPALGVNKAPPNSATPYCEMRCWVEGLIIQSAKACPPEALIPGYLAGFTGITP